MESTCEENGWNGGGSTWEGCEGGGNLYPLPGGCGNCECDLCGMVEEAFDVVSYLYAEVYVGCCDGAGGRVGGGCGRCGCCEVEYGGCG